MNYKIEDIEGVGPKYANQLKGVGIKTTHQFIKLCCNKSGRKGVAEQTGINEKLILTWANLVDLMRITGVGPQFSELLEASGVDTIKELRNRRADSLADKMREVNNQKRLTRAVPTQSVISNWIEIAKKMEPLITH